MMIDLEKAKERIKFYIMNGKKNTFLFFYEKVFIHLLC